MDKFYYFDAVSTELISDKNLRIYLDSLKEDNLNINVKNEYSISKQFKYFNYKRKLATILNIKEDEIILNSGASESISTVFKTFDLESYQLITTSIEHHSVKESINALKYLKDIIYLPLDRYGDLDYEFLSSLEIKKNTIISLTLVNNEVGTLINSSLIKEIVKSLKEKYNYKIYIHMDIAQAIGKTNINFKDFDYASVSAHKFGGAKQSGFLYRKKNAPLIPLIYGSQENNNRGGTTSLPNLILLTNALEDSLSNKREELTNYLYERLEELDFLVLNTNKEKYVNIINLSYPKLLSGVIINFLSSNKILLSSSSACTNDSDKYSKVLYELTKDMTLASTCFRVSVSQDTTKTDIDYLVENLYKLRDL